MIIANQHTGLYTDHYELTMAQGYFLNGMLDTPVVFDYFFRTNPYQGGYTVFGGLSTLLEMLLNYRFDPEARQYLGKIGMESSFLEFLADFSFNANVYAVREGEIVFPFEPCLRVEGTIIEAQLVETLLLNILNFESLVATKAARIRHAAGDRTLMDFGLRRAHGFGGMQASKAALSAGFNTTSNVYGAYLYGLDSTGTMAHSWVQSFKDELTAFHAYAEFFPENCILLVDTYDTLRSGVPNAIKVGHEMAGKGEQLLGVRLDSGDLAYLSKKVREMLDEAGLKQAKIVASNQLDEWVIKSLLDQGAPIDVFGVGTALVTGKGDGALDGVYKLSLIDGKPSLKISDNIRKTTLPGKKTLMRFTDENGRFMADAIALDGEGDPEIIHHPFEPGKSSKISGFKCEKLLRKVMEKGKITETVRSPGEVSDFMQSRLANLPREHKRFMNPHEYKVGISSGLLQLRYDLTRKDNSP